MLDLNELFVISASLLFIIFLELTLSSPKPPTVNVYRKGGRLFWLKTALAYIYLTLKKLTRRLKKVKVKTKEDATGVVYYSGANRNGDLLTMVIKQEAHGMNKICHFRLKMLSENIDLAKTDHNGGSFNVEGSKTAPLKLWKINFDGMLEFNNQKRDCKFDMALSPKFSYFDFNGSFNALDLAKSIAQENWSWNYFNILSAQQQLHHEQFGSVRGQITFSEKCKDINFEGVTFHGSTLRKSFHRCVCHYIKLENGDRFSIKMISMPIVLSSFCYGFVRFAKTAELHVIKNCDFELYQHGENSEPPVDYAFTFTSNDNAFTVQVSEASRSLVNVSENNNWYIYKTFNIYEVNGEKGWGTSEWFYRN